MPYITIPVKTRDYQLTFDDILNGINQDVFDSYNRDTHDTRTVFRGATPAKLLETYDINKMIDDLHLFNEKYKNLIETADKSELYRSFKIPKHSGGLRQINAPNDQLMGALKELKYIFECKMFASYHTAAFSYIKGRSTLDAVKRHQSNKSKWFLKLDFHDFFGSTTFDFTLKQMSHIFPYNEICSSEYGKTELSKALSLCFLNDGLPQGTPISPTITNLIMIPIDHYISKCVRDYKPYLVYTRYADDIILSSRYSFKWTEVQDMLLKILNEFNAPFSLNTKKTRYGSSAGRNWNLGVMLNKDNEITIGHAKKKVFKAMIFSFGRDFSNGVIWNIADCQHLLGLISYYKMVEAHTIDTIISSYNKKMGIDIECILKNIVKTPLAGE